MGLAAGGCVLRTRSKQNVRGFISLISDGQGLNLTSTTSRLNIQINLTNKANSPEEDRGFVTGFKVTEAISTGNHEHDTLHEQMMPANISTGIDSML